MVEYRFGERHSCHTSRRKTGGVAIVAVYGIRAARTAEVLLASASTPLPEFLEDFCRYLSARRTRKSYSSDRSALRVFFGAICPALQLRTPANARSRNDKRRRSLISLRFLSHILRSGFWLPCTSMPAYAARKLSG